MKPIQVSHQNTANKTFSLIKLLQHVKFKRYVLAMVKNGFIEISLTNNSLQIQQVREILMQPSGFFFEYIS